MNPLSVRHTALVLVDYQQRLMPAIHGGEDAVRFATVLADIARLLDVPVLGTEQNPAGLGPNVEALRSRCTVTLAKTHFDASADGLLGALQATDAQPVHQVVIAGCEAHVCLLQTAMGLLRAGLGVAVVAQACGSRSAHSHALAMQRLHDAGAAIVSVEMVAFEWLRDCEHPRFREVLALIKPLPG